MGMPEFRRSFSGAPWESHRRVLPVVAGRGSGVRHRHCTRRGGWRRPCRGDGYGQAMRYFDIIREALAAQGAELSHVVRTRMFVTDIERWEEFGRTHRETFGDHPPTTTMVEVSRLIDPDMLIEIEADAIVTN